MNTINFSRILYKLSMVIISIAVIATEFVGLVIITNGITGA